MCNRSKSLERIVEDVNNIYARLSVLSNDALRNRAQLVDIKIKSSINWRLTIDDSLSEVFAIVKETCRRFSEGDIDVTANDYDCLLAEKFDFVYIKKGKAIYKNNWQVQGFQFHWDMIHYDEQILGGICLHYGHAIEMATGEGKTLVATLPVFLNALSHKGVHLMTVNDYLSKRDYEITRPIYMFHGLRVECLDYYSRHEVLYKEAYRKDITFGTNSTFVFDYLYDHLAMDKRDCVQTNHNFAIIDELDSILIDDADTPHIVSDGEPYNNADIYMKYLSVVKKLTELTDMNLFIANLLTKKVELTANGEKWLNQELNNSNLFKYRKIYEVPDFNNLSEVEKDEITSNINIQNVIHQLLLALTIYIRDIDYVVQKNKVIIIDQNTGRLKETSRWEHGLHTALEVKEKVKVQFDYDGMAVISLKNYFKLYDKICGMSGTIIDAAEEIEEIYGLQCTKIPTHKPINRIDEPLRIYRTTSQKDKAIIAAIINNFESKRPTLIGNISIKRADVIEDLLKNSGLKYNRLDAKNLRDESKMVAKAGVSNTITLSTSVAGRGTDIKPSKDALANGGLCVVGTDLFGSKRIDQQLKGRTGRQGNPGNSIFFTSLDDSILNYLSDDERKELNGLAKGIEGDDISTDNIRAYFYLAQEKRERIYRNQRKKTSRKDDIVAPHRTKFYEHRNSILFNPDRVNELISDILKSSDISIQVIDNALMKHYHKVKELLNRNKSNNRLVTYALIPFSDKQHPFAIQLDIDLALTSDAYYRQEFKRQCILQIYDMFWKGFVLYMMQDLDSKEIQNLDNIYVEMMDNITKHITSRFLNASVTFEIRDHPNDKKDTPLQGKEKDAIHKTPNIDSPCPCGSGKNSENVMEKTHHQL